MKGKNLLVVVLVFLGLFVRLYNFKERMTFGPEQARSLVVAGRYITEKPSLLGQEYFRVTSEGHKLFSGAVFNYSLVPLQLLFNFDPLPITVFFAFLNVFTGLVLFWVAKKIFGYSFAVLSLGLFLFNDYMIYHSTFIWNYNYLPLVGILCFYLLYQMKKNSKRLLFVFFLGILSGVGVSLQYLFALLGLGVFLYVLWFSKEKIKASAIFVFGAILGNLPMVIFDLRHNFYHLVTAWQYFLGAFKGGSGVQLAYYHFLPLWPIFLILLSFVVVKLLNKSKPLGILAVIAYLYLSLTSPKVSFGKAVGMPDGLTYGDVIEASESIAKDVRGDFNVASLLDFDTRGYILRYPVEFMYWKKPKGDEDYSGTPFLYVLAERSYNFEDPGVWELRVNLPYKSEILKEIDQRYAVFRLTHED